MKRSSLAIVMLAMMGTAAARQITTDRMLDRFLGSTEATLKKA